jgi:hemerythrin HHE cation binding domain-containing protein
MSELTRIREDHAKLARMFLELGHAIQRRNPPSQTELFELRHELMSTLIGHLKLEDWALYSRLMDSGDDEISSKGAAFKDEMGGLAPAFLAYCERWTANSITSDWDSYCNETRSILDALTDRLTRENRELLPLLERLDRAA